MPHNVLHDVQFGHGGRGGQLQDHLYQTSNGSGMNQVPKSSPKAIGVHSMLNPSESRPSSGRNGMAPIPPMALEITGSPIHMATPPEPHSANRSHFPGHGNYGSHPGTPLGRPTSSGQPSPPLQHPLPALNNPRKILSPKLPRTTSVSNGYLGHGSDPRRQAYVGYSSPAKRPLEMDLLEDGRQSTYGVHASREGPYATGISHPTPSRSISQPISRPPSAAHSHTSNGPRSRENSARPTGPPLAAPGPRSFSGFENIADNQSPWSDTMRRSGIGMTSGLVGGEEAYMTLPGSDIPIPVQVDYSQASKKADEKRQRNAKASTRHRRKKKTIQEENIKQIQDMRDERHDMAVQIAGLKKQRDFYREERNRLRDVVSHTPSISDHANGPPSPESVQSYVSYGDRSPLSSHEMATPSQGYASEASSTIERPSQRRRTEERPEFTMPVYGTPNSGPPVSLPNPSGSVYGGPPPPRPGSASSVGSMERLPPLRSMDGSQGTMPGSGPHEQDPRTGQWVPVQVRHMETGWATLSRNGADGR